MIENICNDFVITFNDMITEIARISPNCTISNNITYIKVVAESNKQKLINLFIKKVLIYEEQIVSKDKKFFEIKTYQEDIEDDKHFNFLNEIKLEWSKLNEKNKNVIFDYMILLCRMANKYSKQL